MGGFLLVIMPFCVAYFLSRIISRPINLLRYGSQRIGKGELDYRLNIKTGDELEQLADEFNLMSERLEVSYNTLEQKVADRTENLQKEIGERKKALDKLKHHEQMLEVSERDLKRFSRKLLSIREEEKKKLSNSLHDELGSITAALLLRLSIVEEEIKDNNVQGALTATDQTRNLFKESVEKLKKITKDLRILYLDIIGTMLIALDTEGNITLINNKGCEILEVEEKDTLGKNWFDEFLPKEINQEIKKVFDGVFRDNQEIANNYENTVITKTGKIKTINWYNSILYNIKGEIVGIISSGEDVTDKKKYEDNLREIGYRDTLTGLYNRRYYEEKLKEIDNETNYPITLVMGDINGLKLINDAFGHNAGDELLISAANVIKNSCRETDLVARIGGDEFVVAMPNTSETDAEKIISSIHEKLKSISIESIQLSISFGIKTTISAEDDIQEIDRSAEDLMYREKLLEIPSMRSGAIETILNTLYEKCMDNVDFLEHLPSIRPASATRTRSARTASREPPPPISRTRSR